MKRDPRGSKKMIHVVIGTPDEDNCPICRAHAQTKADQVVYEASGPVLVQELPLSQILRCPCPMCVVARQQEMEE